MHSRTRTHWHAKERKALHTTKEKLVAVKRKEKEKKYMKINESKGKRKLATIHRKTTEKLVKEINDTQKR